jgi:hypothetical protein
MIFLTLWGRVVVERGGSHGISVHLRSGRSDRQDLTAAEEGNRGSREGNMSAFAEAAQALHQAADQIDKHTFWVHSRASVEHWRDAIVLLP